MVTRRMVFAPVSRLYRNPVPLLAAVFVLIAAAAFPLTAQADPDLPGKKEKAPKEQKSDSEGNAIRKGRKIGVSLPLSGTGAGFGADLQSMLLFANAKFGGGRYDFVIDDDRCDEVTAEKIAKKFIEVDKVEAVIGYGCSTAILAAAPILEQAKIPTMVVFASSDKVSKAGDYIFRTWPSDKKSAAVLYRYAAKHDKSIALISEATPYAADLRESFYAANMHSGIELRTEEFFSGNTEFRNMILRIRSWSPDAIFINSQDPASFGVVLKALREYKWRGTIYGAFWPANPALRKELGPALDDVIFVDAPPLSALMNGEGWQALNDFNRPIGGTEASFVSVVEGFRALDAALSSGQDVRDYLYRNKFSGVFGGYSFDKDGEIEGLDFIVRRIKNGKPETVKAE